MGFLVELFKPMGMLATEDSEKPELLTANCIRQLSEMTSTQLKAIYKNGKRKVRIESTPEAYAALNEMTSIQLEAIFGDD